MWWKVIFLTAIACLLSRFAQLLWHFGFHKQLYNHAPGRCKTLPGIEYGSEDIQVLPSGIAFISSGMNAPVGTTVHVRNGSIAMFDFNSPDSGIRHLAVDNDNFDYELFNPHGISVWVDKPTGDIFIFVVNHLIEKDVIDKFKFVESSLSLRHVRTYSSDAMFGQINDVVATGPESFYYTNILHSARSPGTDIEVFLFLSWGSVGYHDGKQARIVVSGLRLPNGINMSPDGRFVYVAIFLQGEIHVYGRQEDNSLLYKQGISVGSAVDNIDVNLETGDLWIGSHPLLWQTFRYLPEPEKYTSPSQVLKLVTQDGGGHMTQLTEVYSNDGSEFSGSSTAVEFKGRMLVGSVFSKLLLCDIEYTA